MCGRRGILRYRPLDRDWMIQNRSGRERGEWPTRVRGACGGAIAGLGRSCSVWRFRAVEREPKAHGRLGARCELTWGRDWNRGRPTRACDGKGRTPALQKVRWRLATHRKHETTKEELRRLRKSSEKTGKLLTMTKTRCSGGLLSAEILAALFGEHKVAACP